MPGYRVLSYVHCDDCAKMAVFRCISDAENGPIIAQFCKAHAKQNVGYVPVEDFERDHPRPGRRKKLTVRTPEELAELQASMDELFGNPQNGCPRDE